MLLYPPAKVNIGLFVTDKRTDGFHNIETIFYPIALTDTLEVKISTGSKKLQFECFGELPGEDSENLCYKAYYLLDKAIGLPPVNIRLEKNIPFGAGLGGGSSDAAYTLQAINEICDLGLTPPELSDFASQLGSDCPFFLFNQPALGLGRGEILHPVNLLLGPYHILLVKPPVFVNTAEAYASITPRIPQQHLLELIQTPVHQWRDSVTNDFEESVFSKFPEIEAIKKQMYAQGAVYASMSGSGSSVYGIFNDIPANVDKLFPGCFIWPTDQHFIAD